MTKMKKIIYLIILGFATILYANDSEYYTSGNQLVPLESPNVRLDKEVLKITRANSQSNKFLVDVTYQLYNKGEARDLLIGFESTGQVGDAESEGFFDKKYDVKKLLNAEKKAIKMSTKKHENEYIKNFKVTVNGKHINYKVTNFDHIAKDKFTSPFVGWLYYFPVHLKKGINKIHQTYLFSSETSVKQRYGLSYILETAQRWKSGKIKDFTLILDLGENEQFNVAKTFFDDNNNWQIENGYMKDNIKGDYIKFYIISGKVIFHKKNFIPTGTIWIYASRYFPNNGKFSFDYKEHTLPFQTTFFDTATDAISLKILKAQPFARKGYLFKESNILNYYKKCPWYHINRKYKKSWKSLTIQERKWFLKLTKIEKKILQNIPYAKRGYVFKNYSLSRYFENQKWYKKNLKYKASFSSLSLSEQKWLKKINKLQASKDIDKFFFMPLF